MKIDAGRARASGGESSSAPLLNEAPRHEASAAPPAGDLLPLRTSRSRLLQTVDSMLTGVPSEAQALPSGAPGISLDARASPAFRSQVLASLHQLQQTHTGSAILAQVASAHAMYPDKQVLVRPSTGPTATMASWRNPPHKMPGFNYFDTVVAKPTNDPFMPFVAGSGADTAVVNFNVKQGRDYTHDPHQGQLRPELAFVDLGHELIHANRMLHGSTYAPPMGDSSRDLNTPAAEEELRTTGVGPWRHEPLTENALREDLGLARRQSYAGNPGTRLREPVERNSPHTTQRLQSQGAKLKRD